MLQWENQRLMLSTPMPNEYRWVKSLFTLSHLEWQLLKAGKFWSKENNHLLQLAAHYK